MESKLQQDFWNNVLIAAESQPREAKWVRGISGLEHPVIAVGVDEQRRRLLVISGEHDARSTAIAQLDIQRALEGFKVIVARPTAVNLAVLAHGLCALLGSSELRFNTLANAGANSDTFKRLAESEAAKSVMKGISVATVDWIAQWMQIIQQLGMIELREESKEDGSKAPSGLMLDRLMNFDPVQLDRQLGICSFPLYEFTEEEALKVQIGSDVDAIREILRAHHIFQYFFPAPDQLALGIIDRRLLSPSQVVDELVSTEELGHPFGPQEVVPLETKVGDIVDALHERGLVVEGEVGIEISEQGAATRAQVKFKPREGIVSKLANNVSIKLDLKDLFRPSGQ